MIDWCVKGGIIAIIRVSMRESAKNFVSLKFNLSELEVNIMDQRQNSCLMRGHAKGLVRRAGKEHDDLVRI